METASSDKNEQPGQKSDETESGQIDSTTKQDKKDKKKKHKKKKNKGIAAFMEDGSEANAYQQES